MTGTRRWLALGGAIVAIIALIVIIQVTLDPAPPATVDTTPTEAPAPAAAATAGETPAPPTGPLAPEFVGITAWLNTEPLTMAGLRGKVVLVDFWTYSCVNCIRTLPYLRDWHEKYARHGLVMVGVHAPEFDFEKDEQNVRDAMARQRVAWPVAMDNAHATWSAYRNRYWPRKYLMDRNGVQRYDVIGEGRYRETEEKIRELLTEAGADVSAVPVGGVDAERSVAQVPITRELYAGLKWAPGGYLGNFDTIADVRLREGETVPFTDPGLHDNGRMYLQGRWVLGPESVRHAETTTDFEDYVAILYIAASVNVVIRPDEAAEAFPVVVTHNGAPIPEALRGDDIQTDDAGRTFLLVDEPRLYNVIRGGGVHTGALKLRVNSDEFLFYTFTFGR